MKYYLLLKNVPELSSLTPAERAGVHRCCYQQYGMRSWKIWLALLLYGLLGGCGLVVGKLLFQKAGLPLFLAMCIGLGLGTGIGYAVFRAIVISYLRPFYPGFIRDVLRKP